MATLASGLSTVIGTSSRGQAAIGAIIRTSRFFGLLEETSAWEAQPHQFNFVAATSDIEATPRALNADFSVTTQAPAPKFLGEQAMYGYATGSDITWDLDKMKDLGDSAERLLAVHAANLRRFGLSFVRELFEGESIATPTPNHRMDGLRKISENLPGYDVSRVYNASDTFLDVTTAEGLISLGDLLFETIAEVDEPNALVVNRKLGAKIQWLAKENRVLGSEVVFGKEVPTYDGVPIIIVSNNVITNEEPSGGGEPTNNTTSLYWLGLGEQRLSVATNSGVYYREWEHTPQGEKVKEVTAIHARWKCEDEHSLLRVARIKAA